jgi:mannosyltransferase OCH1-like enzyme
MSNHKVNIAQSPGLKYNQTHQNALMASIPKHPFWECVFKWLEINKNLPVLDAAGPYMLMCAIREEPHNVNSLESKLFAPEIKNAWESQSKFVEKNTNEEIYTRHHSTGTWITKEDFIF